MGGGRVCGGFHLVIVSFLGDVLVHQGVMSSFSKTGGSPLEGSILSHGQYGAKYTPAQVRLTCGKLTPDTDQISAISTRRRSLQYGMCVM